MGAAIVGAGFGLVVLLVVSVGGDPLDTAIGWADGAFGLPYNLSQTLTSAVPLVVVALGAAVPLRTGVIVVGAEGQMIVGAITAAAVLLSVGNSVPPVVSLPLGAVAGAGGGAVWSLLPGVALLRWRASEILSALLATFIAVQVLAYLLRTYLRDPAGAATARSASLPGSALIPWLPGPGRVSTAIFGVLILLAVAMWWHRSRGATLLEIYGERRWLAERSGVTPTGAILATTAVSGATAGLAGWIQLAAVDERLTPAITGGIGFGGLIVAVLGRYRPVPILVAGVVFAAIATGAGGVQVRTGVPSSIGTVAQAVMLGAAVLAIAIVRRRAARRAAGDEAGPQGDHDG
ncbi:ABC transporter permease [Amycolatopsis alba]|uniref:ABC transporter permease n=1 Tax=Amycolatopsis alba DSM 44262 TaxID=1125972 RepID=A0A229R9U8_AMYAL|nr:ABC transporter permease [Amycolatopsis alba]OXM43443.1 ABC transporter permease [Amycolatopsis alba DSM 44262]